MYKFLVLLLLVSSIVAFAQDIVINEVMSSNKVTLLDEDGDASDWIELYNKSAQQINLFGYGLSDDTLNSHKWQFDSIVIQPGEHLIIFASDKDRDSSTLHTNFKLNASGERIILSDSSGAVIDQVDVPASSTDISFARTTDGNLPWIFQFPSPDSSNTGNEFSGFADSISVSVPGGFYPSAISVTLSAGDSKIFYTLNGSDPDSTKTEYAGPISILKTTVLKAISFKANHLPGSKITHTYFINVSSDLPVISLSTDSLNLFDYNYGIYANGPGWTPSAPNHGANFWMDWERPAHVEFFEDDKNLGFSEECGISIYGQYSRSFAQKSFSVKFKNDYGKNKLDYDLFPGFRLKSFKSFLLRNSGNDFQFTHFRDAMMQTLVKDLDIDYLEYRPATTFINGQYWGVYNIREKISEHYVASRHGVDPDNIDMLEGNKEVIHGDTIHYQQLLDYISTNDMTTDEAYNFVNSMIDLDECLLYFAAEVYYNSQDWPANNTKFWRERSPNGKWRWFLYDLDFGFNLYETTGQSENHLTYLLSGIETRPGSNPPWSTLVPRMLVQNPIIKNQFINQIADLLNTNFESTRVVDIINSMADHIAVDIDKHRTRWSINKTTANNHVSSRMISFAEERPGYLRGFVRNFFSCGNDGNILIQTKKGGKVKLNTFYLDSTRALWMGIYFQKNMIHLNAIPDPGYKFDGWSGDTVTQNATMELFVKANSTLVASFSVDSSTAKEIVINEINYNSAGSFETGDWIELYNRSTATIDLSNWRFSDSDTSHGFVFPNGTTLEPNHYLVLVENDSAFTSRFPAVMNYIGETGFGLNGSGEHIQLTNEVGQIIDSLTYDDVAPWPTEADGSGATLELLDAVRDNSAGTNWMASKEHGSPGKVNTVVTSVEKNKNDNLPEKYFLYQNYPNPFNPTTNIEFDLPASSFISLKIFDILGREVATLISRELTAGRYSQVWDAANFSSGVYFYSLQTKNFRTVKKLLLQK